MKKVTFFLIIAMISFSVYSTNAQAKLTKTEDKFIQTITKDFIDTHDINLNGYNFYDMREIFPDKDNLTPQEKSLTNIFMGIAKKQYFMDCSPIFYINEINNKGLVLEKKLSGMNNLYFMSYDNTNKRWKVTVEVSKMGKDLVDLGLLKGAE